ncbi:MAG: mannose-6-phosphate isomerase [Patescibacteria group bacterium]
MDFIERPWGGYVIHAQGPGWALKTLHIKAGEATSLQLHRERSESWYLMDGDASIEGKDGTLRKLEQGKEVNIAQGEVHRLVGGPTDAVLVEIIRGNYREDDIERIEDRYGRS